MKTSIIASSLALVAGAAATGSAIVVNKCEYDVYLFNTPSAGGGYSEIDKVLSTDGTYTQKYTELSNGNGWSLKLSNHSTISGGILQYEYTFHDDGTIWYDLSEVDGNPWNGNWEITSDSSSCVPRQAAYRYATDDAYGMQACPDSATITVTLCSGESQNDGAAASASSSVAAETVSIAPTTASAPVVSTTLQKSVITSAAATSDVVVTVTSVATTTRWSHRGSPSKRDADAHAHHHAARHPHVRN